jgi:hypothetical protein
MIEKTERNAMFPIVLRRDILIALGLKAALLAILYLLFFSPSHRPHETVVAMRQHIFGQP